MTLTPPVRFAFLFLIGAMLFGAVTLHLRNADFEAHQVVTGGAK